MRERGGGATRKEGNKGALMKGRGKGGGSVDKRGGKKGLLVKKRAAKKVGRKERGITGEVRKKQKQKFVIILDVLHQKTCFFIRFLSHKFYLFFLVVFSCSSENSCSSSSFSLFLFSLLFPFFRKCEVEEEFFSKKGEVCGCGE